MKQKKKNNRRMADSGDKGAETDLTTDIIALLESATSEEDAEELWAFLESLDNHTYKPPR